MGIGFRRGLGGALAAGIVAGLHLSLCLGDVPGTQVRHLQEEAIGKGNQLYRSKDVSFQNSRAHVKLAGTISFPNGKGLFPAVLLIAAGPEGRDEEVMGHHVDRRKLGVIGHSEGGSIAPAVAVNDPDVAFVVAMAGSGHSVLRGPGRCGNS